MALEWRIREDVPTNLRSVKLSSETVGFEGVKRLRGGAGEGSSADTEPRLGLYDPAAAAAAAAKTSSSEATPESTSKRIRRFMRGSSFDSEETLATF